MLFDARNFFLACIASIAFDKLLDIDQLAYVFAGILVIYAFLLLTREEESREQDLENENIQVGISPTTTTVEVSSEEVIREVTITSKDEVVQLTETVQEVTVSVSVPGKHEQESLLDELQRMYDEDRPFEAVQELQRLRANNLLTAEAEFSEASKNLIADVDVARIEIFGLTDLLEKEGNWKHRMHHKTCDIYASTIDPRDFKVVCVCPDSNLYDLISLILETQLYYKWMPGCTKSTRWDHSMFYQNLYLRLSVPFPFKDRDVLLKGYGDVWKGSKVMIYVKSIESKEAERRLDVKPGPVRAEVGFSGILLRPLGPEKGVEITLISRLDIKLALLPDVIFDYAAKFVLVELCVYLRDTSKSMATHPEDPKHKPWRERQVGSDAQAYREIRERLSKMTVDETR
jgi:hypothetical protein